MTSPHSSRILTKAFEKLSYAEDLITITMAVAEAARDLSGADGATFVLRDGDLCYYVDEDSISPLWKGQRFPMQSCISGWSMVHQEPVIIPDIYVDSRIPHEAYRPTFVKSLCMIPIRVEKPIGVIGNYWSTGNVPSSEIIKSLQILANSTAIALENLELKLAVKSKSSEAAGLMAKTHELELALHLMAHDLRTPLSGMMGMAELLKHRLGSQLDDKSREFVQAIVDTGLQTGAQIERMLSLYRSYNGRANGPVAKQLLDVSLMFQQQIESFKPSLLNSEIEFNVQPELKAYADPPLLEIALSNLLSNSIKYSSKKTRPKIEIGLHKDEPGFKTFYIRDNGEGFDQASAAKLFQPLSRLHSAQEFEGTGLGLASVAKIIELHGGHCHAEGKPREGATFYFSLPAQA